MKQMSFYVRLWQDLMVQQPTIEEYVQSTSEAHAVVHVMKAHHLNFVDRAWIAHTAKEPPTMRLGQVFVKGKIRSWKIEPETWFTQA